ncbi:hypothetical protein ZWY2020_047705 [Hordeum vulgare]|nr:hypothetical protein ZWY2020_047705 [Hordeum vulgare]
MAGRGSKQAPLQRQSGQQAGQGNPPVAKPTATAAAQPGKFAPATASAQPGNTHVPAHAESGSKDNAEGSNDTGPNSFPKQTSNPQQNQPNLGARNGPSNSAMHKDLRFGAFEPTSAPAKIGSRVASFESSLPRFLGKTPRTYNGSEQSKSTLKPLSLEEYLVGAKATSTTLPTVHASTGAGPAIAGMEEGTADGLGSPTCQP